MVERTEDVTDDMWPAMTGGMGVVIADGFAEGSATTGEDKGRALRLEKVPIGHSTRCFYGLWGKLAWIHEPNETNRLLRSCSLGTLRKAKYRPSVFVVGDLIEVLAEIDFWVRSRFETTGMRLARNL